jgi:hypothetical protein
MRAAMFRPHMSVDNAIAAPNLSQRMAGSLIVQLAQSLA